ncbi:hypothetical protein CMUS01_07279 [Colletotrichum musicola]|uniref:WD-like domain-containing protein n=2 Tax=Colletotrichum orchidearum species complex TaxID=2707337 RepID=A0A8H6KHD3_9PEZI|nr:hypothetical protein CPLU01_11475 [Colletotrichum plurivorum]KAF6831579.1 hypothetical protein CMUS01_07279 [Colletotrichum musicola]
MKFTLATVAAVACFFQAGVNALPAVDVESTALVSDTLPANITLLSTEEFVIDGLKAVLQTFVDETAPGEDEVIEEESALAKRCGSNQVGCDMNNNRAQKRVCGMLMDRLGGDTAQSVTPYTSQCMTVSGVGSNNVCCTAWQRKVSLRRRHLLNAMADIMNRCTSGNDLVSGDARDVDLNGSCQRQCLSNRNFCN